MEISDNMKVYSEKSHWIHYHICFKHDQLQSDLSLFVQWRTRDYIELLLVSIHTEQTLCQTVYSTCCLWGSMILQINARALRRFFPLAWSSALASHFSVRESLYSSTLHEAHFWQNANRRGMRFAWEKTVMNVSIVRTPLLVLIGMYTGIRAPLGWAWVKAGSGPEPKCHGRDVNGGWRALRSVSKPTAGGTLVF